MSLHGALLSEVNQIPETLWGRCTGSPPFVCESADSRLDRKKHGYIYC